MATDFDYTGCDGLAKALTFAIIEHHKLGQTREDNITPYGEHLVRVIEKLRVIGGVSNYNDLIAAALHDILEDTDITAEFIEKEYGSDVLYLVEGMTQKPGQSKDDYLFLQIAKADDRVKAIKLADRLDNIQDVMRLKTKTFGNVPPIEYILPSSKLLEICRSGNAALAAELEIAIEQAIKMFS